ncbi:MAG: tRNA pseudouridine(55) synthase TruB, partial [Candidatus Nanopelagicales bacterium]
MNSPDGFVIVDKPKDLTSHDVVNKLRKFFNTRSIGH